MPLTLVGGGGAKNGYFWPFGAKNRDFLGFLGFLGPKTGVFGIFGGGPKIRIFGNIFTSAAPFKFLPAPESRQYLRIMLSLVLLLLQRPPKISHLRLEFINFSQRFLGCRQHFLVVTRHLQMKYRSLQIDINYGPQ